MPISPTTSRSASTDSTATAPAATAASNSLPFMASVTRMLPVGRPTPTSNSSKVAPISLASTVMVATPLRMASTMAAVTSAG